MLEDMLRACVLDHKSSWEEHLPLVEFAYNNSYQASIQMAPYEALYGRSCICKTRENPCRIMYFLECVYVESLHVHLGGE